MLINAESVLIDFLRTKPIWAELAGRIHAGPELPKGYQPKQGAAILLSVRSMAHDYTRAVARTVMQFTIYAIDATKVRETETRLYETINDKSSANILGIFHNQSAGLGQTPDGGWWFAVSLYNCQLINTK